MQEKDKYDTNPLDPDFVRRTEKVSSADTNDVSLPLGDAHDETNARQRESAEAPTVRFENNSSSTSYPSVFQSNAYVPPPARQNVEPPYVAPNFNSSSPGGRSVKGLNFPERIACVLPYAPFYIGIVAAVIELILTPRVETRTRFHAAQGLALHLAILGISFLFTCLRLFTGSRVGGSLFGLAGTIFLIVSMVRVWKCKEHRIPPLADATRWLNEKFEPRK